MALSGHFDTFQGGWWVGGWWVGGWVGQIKIIDHLSPAEAETWAELAITSEVVSVGLCVFFSLSLSATIHK